jgi:hypothetical protein
MLISKPKLKASDPHVSPGPRGAMVLRLDSFRGSQYVSLRGFGPSVILGCLGLAAQNLCLGVLLCGSPLSA